MSAPMAEKFIQKAIKHPGALRASLHVTGDKPIPAARLAKAAKAGGTLGRRARLAQTLRSMRRGKRSQGRSDSR